MKCFSVIALPIQLVTLEDTGMRPNFRIPLVEIVLRKLHPLFPKTSTQDPPHGFFCCFCFYFLIFVKFFPMSRVGILGVPATPKVTSEGNDSHWTVPVDLRQGSCAHQTSSLCLPLISKLTYHTRCNQVRPKCFQCDSHNDQVLLLDITMFSEYPESFTLYSPRHMNTSEMCDTHTVSMFSSLQNRWL